MSHKLNLVLFTTSNCAYCPAMKKDLDSIKESLGDKIGEYTTWTVDKQPAGLKIAKEWGINGVPTVLLIANQEEIGRVIGSARKKVLENAIERCLQPDIFQESSDRSKLPRGFILCDTGEPLDDEQGSSEDRDS